MAKFAKSPVVSALLLLVARKSGIHARSLSCGNALLRELAREREARAALRGSQAAPPTTPTTATRAGGNKESDEDGLGTSIQIEQKEESEEEEYEEEGDEIEYEYSSYEEGGEADDSSASEDGQSGPLVNFVAMDNETLAPARANTIGECRAALARAAVGKGDGEEHESAVSAEARRFKLYVGGQEDACSDDTEIRALSTTPALQKDGSFTLFVLNSVGEALTDEWDYSCSSSEDDEGDNQQRNEADARRHCRQEVMDTILERAFEMDGTERVLEHPLVQRGTRAEKKAEHPWAPRNVANRFVQSIFRANPGAENALRAKIETALASGRPSEADLKQIANETVNEKAIADGRALLLEELDAAEQDRAWEWSDDGEDYDGEDSSDEGEDEAVDGVRLRHHVKVALLEGGFTDEKLENLSPAVEKMMGKNTNVIGSRFLDILLRGDPARKSQLEAAIRTQSGVARDEVHLGKKLEAWAKDVAAGFKDAAEAAADELLAALAREEEEKRNAIAWEDLNEEDLNESDSSAEDEGERDEKQTRMADARFLNMRVVEKLTEHIHEADIDMGEMNELGSEGIMKAFFGALFSDNEGLRDSIESQIRKAAEANRARSDAKWVDSMVAKIVNADVAKKACKAGTALSIWKRQSAAERESGSSFASGFEKRVITVHSMDRHEPLILVAQTSKARDVNMRSEQLAHRVAAHWGKNPNKSTDLPKLFRAGQEEALGPKERVLASAGDVSEEAIIFAMFSAVESDANEEETRGSAPKENLAMDRVEV